jgi:hypothetical protein
MEDEQSHVTQLNCRNTSGDLDHGTHTQGEERNRESVPHLVLFSP